MDVNVFSEWLKDSFNFDSGSNVLFKNALIETFRMFSSSTYNGVPFLEHYKDNLHQELLSHYVGQLKMLIQQIPEPTSIVSLNILRIPLNEFWSQKEELLQQVSQLKH